MHTLVKLALNPIVLTVFAILFSAMTVAMPMADSVLKTSPQQSKNLSLSAAKPKVVALAPNIVEIVFAIGAGQQIIGASEHSDFPESAKQISRVSNYLTINIEKIIALNPDVVISWKGGSPEQGLNKLQQLGIPVVEFEANTPSQFLAQVKAIGILLKRESSARILVQQLQYTLDKTQASFAMSNKLNGIIEVWPQPLTLATKQTIIDQALTICGFNNVFPGDVNQYPQVSLEQVLTLPVDIIVQPKSVSNPTDTMNWSRYDHFTAVQKGAYFSPDSDVFFRWTPRWIRHLPELCQDLDTFRPSEKR